MPKLHSPPPLPQMTRIHQSFDRSRIDNVPESVRSRLDASNVKLKPGTTLAIGVGSRGIDQIAVVVKAIVDWAKDAGARPFIVPAMGSHGGATADGQREVLAYYGVTEASTGAEIRSSMETVRLPQEDLEVPIFWDANAAKADATIVVNRIKVHTDYHGKYESGLIKMIAIGMGKQDQPMAIHERGVPGLTDLMPRVAFQKIKHSNLVMGVALVENAYDELCRIEAIPAKDIADAEPGILDDQRKRMPRLPIDDIDLLIVDEMGKDISGTGMDTNIIGRMFITGEPEPTSPNCRVISVHSLTTGAHGNAVGTGLADVTTRRLADAADWAATYENLYTATFLPRAKLPVVCETDAQAMAFAVRGARGAGASLDRDGLRIVRIKNTLALEAVDVSAAVLADIEHRDDIQVIQRDRTILTGDHLTAF